jgi:hypothetical protein
MNKIISLSILYISLGCLLGCKSSVNSEAEKSAILETLNGETKAFFNRDYNSWKDKWVHEKFVSKTYMRMPDSSLSETLGWDAIDKFGNSYIKQHPDPEPVPKLLNNISVRLYDNAAWVNFEQQDSLRGLKRETRLMEKQEGRWKIAGMHTTIYGF